MAIFTRNKNPKALLGNQKLFNICCDDPAPDPCCYSTEAPRPPTLCQECGGSIVRNYVVNGINVGNPILIVIDTSMLPAIIEVFFENTNRDCDATFGKITSDSPNLNINITTYSYGTIGPGMIELVATIQLNIGLVEGAYTPYLNYYLCGNLYSLGIDIQIDAL